MREKERSGSSGDEVRMKEGERFELEVAYANN